MTGHTETHEEKENGFFEFLKSPWALLGSVAGGVIYAVYLHDHVWFLTPIGYLYLLLLQMTVIPIMISAIVTSIGKFVRTHQGKNLLLRYFPAVVGTSLVTMCIGLVVGLIGRPGEGLSESARSVLGHMIIAMEEVFAGTPVTSMQDTAMRGAAETTNVVDFVMDIVPRNIFESLGQGHSLQIIAFFVILGIMIRYIPERSSEVIIDFFEGIFAAFERLIEFIEYLLPIGTFCLVADHMAHIDTATLAALGKFVIYIYVAALLVFVVNTIILSIRAKQSAFTVLNQLRNAIVISIATRNAFATIPATLDGLVKQLRFSPNRTKLVIPFGFTVFRYGTFMLFPLTAVFLSQLYDIPLSIPQYLVILASTFLATIATAGAPGVMALSTIAMVLIPAGLPVSTGVIILVVLDPLIDSIMSLTNTLSNTAVATIVASPEQEISEDDF